jgi:nucleoside-diphosphate-sugar epimerase
MKILLTGGSGFVGKNLLKKFAHNDQYEFLNISRTEITGFNNCNNFIVDDISSVTNWDDLLKGIDVVIHLAARVHILNDSEPNAKERFYEINVAVTKKIAEAAKRAKVSKFIFLSSVKVMGEKSFVPFNHNTEPLPEDDYGKSKLLAEKEIELILKDSDCYFILRPPLIYGPGVKANFMKLANLSRKGLPLPFGSFNQKRSFLFVDNLISIIENVLENDYPSGKYFVSDDHDLSLSELLYLMGTTSKKRLNLLKVSPRLIKFLLQSIGMGRVYQKLNTSLQVDISLTKEQLNWTPPYSVEEGLKKTLTNE